MLSRCVNNLPGLDKAAMQTDSAFKAEYHKNLGPSLFGAAYLQHEDQADAYGAHRQGAADENVRPAANNQKDRDRNGLVLPKLDRVSHLLSTVARSGTE